MGGKRRVVVTGMGVVSALGLDEESHWERLMSGRHGIRRVAALPVEAYKTTVGAEVDTPALEAALAALGYKPLDRAVDMATVAAGRALRQAGLVDAAGAPPGPTPTAVIFGTGTGCSHSVAAAWTSYAARGLKSVRPTTVPRCMSNAISAQLSMRFRLTGTNYVIVCACSSATVAIGTAFRNIRDGYFERALCGGADAVFDFGTFTSWNALGVMSRNPDPDAACRPFDADRDGCVLGEGAGALVLESLEAARARGARIRAEVLGFGESADALHITSPNPEGQAAAMRAALDDARLAPGDVGFINAHGTATRANDECESRSLRAVFGAAADAIPLGANKPFFGHLLGASGAVESIVTVLGLERRRVPPTLNCPRPDPACPVRLVGPEPMPLAAPVAMKTSFAFGGQNAVLVFRRGDEEDRQSPTPE